MKRSLLKQIMDYNLSTNLALWLNHLNFGFLYYLSIYFMQYSTYVFWQNSLILTLFLANFSGINFLLLKAHRFFYNLVTNERNFDASDYLIAFVICSLRGIFLADNIYYYYGYNNGFHLFWLMCLPNFIYSFSKLIFYFIKYKFCVKFGLQEIYQYAQLKKGVQEDCNICWQNKNSHLVLACGHSFCKPCIIYWFNQQYKNRINSTCPTCRHIIIPYLEKEEVRNEQNDNFWQDINIRGIFNDYSDDEIEYFFFQASAFFLVFMILAIYIDQYNLGKLIFTKTFLKQIVLQVLLFKKLIDQILGTNKKDKYILIGLIFLYIYFDFFVI